MTKRVYQDIVYLLHTYLMVIYKENTLVNIYRYKWKLLYDMVFGESNKLRKFGANC